MVQMEMERNQGRFKIITVEFVQLYKREHASDVVSAVRYDQCFFSTGCDSLKLVTDLLLTRRSGMTCLRGYVQANIHRKIAIKCNLIGWLSTDTV